MVTADHRLSRLILHIDPITSICISMYPSLYEEKSLNPSNIQYEIGSNAVLRENDFIIMAKSYLEIVETLKIQ